jgi:hypothetical protein
MNVIRIAISIFLLGVIVLAVLGWQWAGQQPETFQAGGARAVLSLGALGSLFALYMLWRPDRHGHAH